MKILLITDKIKIMTIISNFITLNISNNVNILLASDNKSAKLILSEHNIDLIIWEHTLFDLNFYKRHLTLIPILLVNSSYNYDKLIFKNFKCISLDNLSLLSYYIHKYISVSDALGNTKLDILKELIYLGFNIKHKGTKYIAESILILKFYCKNSNLKDIYAIIAREHSTTSENIKSNILKSINYMYYETDFSKLATYFSLTEDIKPTPKQIILTVLNNI